MPKRASVTKAEARRVIQAAQECGLSIKEIVATVDGVRLVVNADQEDRPQEDDNVRRPKQWAI